jgi:TolA-binding protein
MSHFEAPSQLDVDELATRLPRYEPRPEQVAAVRNALLAEAEALDRPHHRRWPWLVVPILAATAAALVLWMTTSPPDRPANRPAIAQAPAGSSAVPDAMPGAAPGRVQMRDGIASFDVTTPLRIIAGDREIIAEPGTKLDAEVRGNRLRRVTVTAGWVVLASQYGSPTLVTTRQAWDLEHDEQIVPPTAPAQDGPTTRVPTAARAEQIAVPVGEASDASASAPRSAQQPRLPTSPRVRRAPANLEVDNRTELPARRPPEPSLPQPGVTAPPVLAPASDTARPGAAQTAPEQARPLPTSPPISSAEQQFAQGLRTLTKGKAEAALRPLISSCQAGVSISEEACYWAAVARLRSGDRRGATIAFASILTRWPQSTRVGEASVALGWLLLERGDRSGARTRFAAAINDSSPSVRAAARRGLEVSDQ